MASEPEKKDHHFVPKCYLKFWEDPITNKIFRYHVNYRGVLKEYQKGKSGIAFRKYLYSIKSNPEKVNRVENVLSGIDNNGCIAQEKLIREGVNALSANERRNWSQFILSLIERNPKHLVNLKKNFKQERDIVFELCKEKFSLSNEFVSDLKRNFVNDEYLHDTIVHKLLKILDESNDWVNAFSRWNWITIDVTQSPHKFITSDEPVLTNFGNENQTGKKAQFISIPISPEVLFVAFHKQFNWDEELTRYAVILHNFMMILNEPNCILSKYALQDEEYFKYQKALKDLPRTAEFDG